MRIVGTSAAFAIAALSGCGDRAVTTRTEQIGATRAAIQGGNVDQQHPFALGVCGLASGPGQCQVVCSGALIAPNLVVTARHCVDDAPTEPDCTTAQFGNPLYTSPKQYYVTTSYQMYQPTQGWHRVSDIRVPSDTHLCGNDLALLILGDVVSSSEATPVTPAVQFALTDRGHWPGLSETAIGYGITSPNTNTEGTRRIRSNIAIQCIPGDTQIGCDPAQVFGGDPKEFLAGDGTCEGDSGSSAYEESDFESGTFVSLGVLSRGGVSSDGMSCIAGVYTRLDVFHDLIVSTALDAAKLGGYAPPAWTASVSAPDGGTPSGTALGGACDSSDTCASGDCRVQNGGSAVCSQACDIAKNPCPSPFACVSGYCFAATPSPTTTTSKGCAIAPVPGGSDDAGGALAFALVLLGGGAAFCRRRARGGARFIQ